MKQNDMYNLVLGAAVVMIAYMALKQKKGIKAPAPVTGPATTDWAEEWLSTITYS